MASFLERLHKGAPMRRIILLFIVAQLLPGCTAAIPYKWQDTRQPARDSATADLEECRTYTARQYRPGMPAGEPYLKGQEVETDKNSDDNNGPWRPDRSPWPIINNNVQPVHEVPVGYTGYPGELDYHPDYLDAILEKCMYDRGWEYREMKREE